MSFRAWYDAGFTALVPVIPPGATLNPFSTVKPEQCGKVPGRKRPDETWTGMKEWLRHDTQPKDCKEWATWYPGTPSIGLRAEHFPAIDIDVKEYRLVRKIQSCAETVLGRTALRTREDSSKALMIYRTDAPFKRLRLWFTSKGTPHLIEVLGAGNQFLVEGEHQGGSRYAWSKTFRAEDLPTIDATAAWAFLQEVQLVLGRAGCTDFKLEGAGREAVDRPTIAQPELAAPSVAAVEALLRQAPNTEETFPGRDDYLKVGYAVKASLPQAPEEALALWLAWASDWPTYDEETARGDWERLQAPFTIGYDYLVGLARSAGATLAPDEFADICDPAPLPEVKAEERIDVVTYSDAWVADLFLTTHGHAVRYNERLGGWLHWDGVRWAADTGGQVAAWVVRSCRWAGRHALDHAGKPGPVIAKECASNSKRKNVQSYASTDQRVNVPTEAFDADPWALNTPGGIVDLRTGVLTPAEPGRLFTRCTAVAPQRGPTPLWDQFLREATHGDVELAKYLQRLAGYALTGSTREHVLAFLWGPGGNGKGVFLNTLVRAFGSYAAVAAMDTFTSSRFDRHPAELAALMGARLVTAQETQEDRSWDEAKVKSITGGDPITARFMRQDFFTYTPQFKLLFAGNHRPHIRNLDDAMRRRFHLVPFTTRPSVPDQALAERLQAEWPAILQWAVDGCLVWQATGLQAPQAVVEATENYFVDEDPVGRWMSERTITVPPHDPSGTDTQELFNDWRRWCLEQNEKPGIERAFVQALLARGLERWRHPQTRRRGLAGVALRDSMEALPPPGLKEAAFLH